MSAVTKKHNTESPRSEELFKKRIKVQVTPADLCNVVIENDSSEEENFEKIDDLTSSDDVDAHTDMSEESEVEPVEDTTNINWFENKNETEEQIIYKEAIGLKALPLGQQPRDFFDLLMNKRIYNLIIKNTNTYMSRFVKNENDPKTSSSVPYLKEDETQKFLGLLFLIEVIQLPDINLYWSNDLLFNFPSFRQTMSMDRFFFILNSLNFSDDRNSTDPLKKVRPLTDFFNTLMESIYTPQRKLIMNDPINLYKSPRARRVEVFTLSEPNGMVLKYLVHRKTKEEQGKNFQKKYNIAKELMEQKLGKGHFVYMGEYFTSIQLIKTLKADNTLATGTLSQPNRKCYEKLWETFSDKNDFSRFCGEGIWLLKWKEKEKETVCISSEFDESFTKTIERQKAKTKPPAIVELDTYLKAKNNWIDKPEVLCQLGNKKLQWYNRVGLQIINILMINCYHLYSQCPSAKGVSFLKFKLNVIKTLLYSGSGPEDKLPSQSMDRSSRPHVLNYIGRNDKGFRKRKRCKYCISERGVRVDSYYHCITCENQPGFCIGQCFIKYHKYDSP